MNLLRPEIALALQKGREVIAALAIVLIGLWLIWLGGYLLVPTGLAVAGLGAVLARLAWRRMRFAQAVLAPGVVELDEAQVGYLGPDGGGFLSVKELVELRLLALDGRRMWRLKQADGQALLIPVDAQGAEQLFDAFAALPGMDTGALVAAAQPGPRPPNPDGAANPGETQNIAETRVIWRRPSWAKLPANPRARP